MSNQPLARLFREWMESGGEPLQSEAFVRATRGLFAAIAWRVAGQFGGCTHDEIEDQVQDIYLKLFAHGPSILERMPSNAESAQSYLRIAAANVCRDAWKAKNAGRRAHERTVPFSSVESQMTQLGMPDVERQLLLQRANKLITNRREKIVFHLYYEQGYSALEISQIPAVKLSVKGVESLIFRITAKLRTELARQKKEGNSSTASS
ncbi:MAG: sigma-70 family RNA polymerase sigma factor [Bryobacterales bacterium]|nr:sigma-70 family RNA polymerase sigma factor [Bryobacterales bacterium]